MPTLELQNATIVAKANVYFGDRCISHSLTLAGGVKKSVGVVFPTEQRFSTAQAETMECVAGSCEYRLKDSTEWQSASAGESFSVPANAYFDIRVTEPYHYICHYA